jgi:biopolymer transport protein ExbB
MSKFRKPQLPIAPLSLALVMLAGISVPLLAQTNGGATTNGVQVTTSDHETKVIASKTLLQVIQDGGPMMLLIGICSVVLLVFVFERAISLRKGRIIPRPFVKRFMQQLREGDLDADTAMELCQKNRSPVAEVFAAAIQKWNRPSVEIEQAIIDSGERVTNGLRKYLRLINGVATVTPLLGLLGTVLGMIHAFDAIGSVDQSIRPETVIATGISQALLTTAAGLAIAIPALITYLFFVGRVDQLVVEIDSLGQQIVSIIASDAWRPSKDGEGSSRGRGNKTKRSAA